MQKWFNLSKEQAKFARERTYFCVVIYDIINNKRRLKLSKFLEGYGVRVQRSCFEMKIDYKVYLELIDDIVDFYEEAEGDSIIIYKVDDTVVKRYSMNEPEFENEYYIEL